MIDLGALRRLRLNSHPFLDTPKIREFFETGEPDRVLDRQG